MRIAKLKHASLHWREDGDPKGPAVVFANSLGTDLRLWDEVVARLPQGLRLIRFDMRGHGLSSCPPAPYALDDLVQDCEELLEVLEVRDCVFVGLSLGGMVGQALAATRPDLIRALVLSNTAVKMGDPALWQARIDDVRSEGIEAIADQIMLRWFGDAFRQSPDLDGWKNMLIRTPAEGYIGACAAIAGCELSASTKGLRLPVLGIAGSEDGASPPELVKATIDLIPGARFELIEGAGHLPCVEAPEHYASLLLGFLKEVSHV
jgi:3-oxoadipate enol-lactonase